MHMNVKWDLRATGEGDNFHQMITMRLICLSQLWLCRWERGSTAEWKYSVFILYIHSKCWFSSEIFNHASEPATHMKNVFWWRTHHLSLCKICSSFGPLYPIATKKPNSIIANICFHIFPSSVFLSVLSPEARILAFQMGFSTSSVSRNLCQMWDYGWLLRNQFYLCVLNAIQSACVLKHLKMSASHKMCCAEVKMGLCPPSPTLVRTGNKLSNANDPRRPVRWTLRCIGGLAVIF